MEAFKWADTEQLQEEKKSRIQKEPLCLQSMQER